MKTCLYLGCGRDLMPSDDEHHWINCDKFPLDDRVRYADVTRLFDWTDGSVDHIKTHYTLEHLDYMAEKYAWHEMVRVLKPGGTLDIRVPDFVSTVETWLAAKDDWKGFYQIIPNNDKTHPEYGFGNGPALDNRWGVLLTWIFGSQSQPGLYHVNAYTEGKLRGMLHHFGCEITTLERVHHRDAWMLQAHARKKTGS